MKIKLYKLLEMIDNGEEPPEKIEIQDYTEHIYEFEKHESSIFYGPAGYNKIISYWCNEEEEELLRFLRKNFNLQEIASLEVEIIEEIDKVIKPLEISDKNGKITDKNSDNYEYGDNCELLLATKINEIIKVINKEEKDE